MSRAFSGAIKAVAIAEYLIILTGSGSVRILATGVVVGYVILHMGGLKVGTTFQNVTTAIKVVVLAAIALAGIAAGDGSGLVAAPTVAHASLLGFALAYQSVAFAYYGWEDAAKMAEEVRDPGRSLPRILIGGAAAVAVLYLLVNTAYLAALTPEEMAGSELVARDDHRGDRAGDRRRRSTHHDGIPPAHRFQTGYRPGGGHRSSGFRRRWPKTSSSTNSTHLKSISRTPSSTRR